MAQEDTDEKHESHTERYSENLYLSQIYTGKDDKGVKNDGGCERFIVGF